MVFLATYHELLNYTKLACKFCFKESYLFFITVRLMVLNLASQNTVEVNKCTGSFWHSLEMCYKKKQWEINSI